MKLSYPASLSIDDGSDLKKYTYKEKDLDQATAYFDSLDDESLLYDCHHPVVTPICVIKTPCVIRNL